MRVSRHLTLRLNLLRSHVQKRKMAIVATSSINPHSCPAAWSHYPKTYVVPKVSTPLIDRIDGNLEKDVWSLAPWSDAFDDIRGAHDAPPSERPGSACETRVKMLWDDQYLYIGALLHSDMTTVATFTERNDPIYQQDSDFEVFVDPLGSCHNYKEFEVNAINTVWNLMLDRPYNDGGQEHSGRIAKPGDELYYDVQRQKSAAKVVDGALNDPTRGAKWSVEIAMAYSDLLSKVKGTPPKAGSRWRINFSRVEKKGIINWTWQPQIAWDPEEHRYRGFVNMHLPDAWGYLVFADPTTGDRQDIASDSLWPVRFALINVYYSQHEYRRLNGLYADSLEKLRPLMDSEVVDCFEIDLELKKDYTAFSASIGQDGTTAIVRDDRSIEIVANQGSTE